MAQYVDKSAVVAMIEKELQNLIACKENTSFTESRVVLWAKIDICKEILSFINTPEVKEVDLDKTINDYFKDWKFDEELDIMVKPNNYSATFNDIKEVAKHFFELGLKAKEE